LSIGLDNTSFSGLYESGNLQKQVDSQTDYHLKLGAGDFYGDIVITQPFFTLEGSGERTVIRGSVQIAAPNVTLRNFAVRSTTTGYGVKISKGLGAAVPTGGIARARLERLFLGASSQGAGDGGIGDGLYLDGAILAEIHQCTFAFNSANGVRSVASNLSFPTTTLRFHGCTFNLNGVYGAQFTGPGMSQIQILGGNMEQNAFGELQFDAVSGMLVSGVDFETRQTAGTLGNVIQAGTSNPVTVENCNFVNVDGSGSNTRAVRAFLFQSCNTVRVQGCRMSGYATGSIGQTDLNTPNVAIINNVLVDAGTYLEAHRH